MLYSDVVVFIDVRTQITGLSDVDWSDHHPVYSWTLHLSSEWRLSDYKRQPIGHASDIPDPTPFCILFLFRVFHYYPWNWTLYLCNHTFFYLAVKWQESLNEELEEGIVPLDIGWHIFSLHISAKELYSRPEPLPRRIPHQIRHFTHRTEFNE